MVNPVSGANLSPVSNPGAGTAPVVIATDVIKSFGETRALRGASFTAFPGEIHAVVGENGSGKSTLAKIISGIVLQDSGLVETNGVALDTPLKALKAGVATVFQEVLVSEGASIAENVFMGLENSWHNKISRKEKNALSQQLLARLTGQDLDSRQLVDFLPLALRQWVTIARALVRNPKVVIFDESTAALDLESTNRLYEEMQRLRSEGVAVIVVTHRIAELTAFADRATVLRDGKDVGVLSGDEINLEMLLELMSGDSSVHGKRVSSLAVERRERLAANEMVLRVKNVAVQSQEDSTSFEVRAGEIIGFAGLEGQGQVAFIQAIAGVVPHAKGIIEILANGSGGMQINSLTDAALARVGYISGDRQREGLFTNLSIFENFAMPSYRASRKLGIINRANLDTAFEKGARDLSLRFGRSQDIITSLSGGNQQKVLIARVLAQQPRLITLNDPARGVDIKTKRELYEELEKLASDGTAVLYLSTEVDELVDFCDKVAVFREGAVFDWVEGEEISSDRILAAMFGHLEAGFNVEDALAGAN